MRQYLASRRRIAPVSVFGFASGRSCAVASRRAFLPNARRPARPLDGIPIKPATTERNPRWPPP